MNWPKTRDGENLKCLQLQNLSSLVGGLTSAKTSNINRWIEQMADL